MAKQLSLSGAITRLVDNVQQDSNSFSYLKTFNRLARLDVVVAQSASETSYEPAGFTVLDFIYIASDVEIVIRTVAAGTQYDVGPGAPFIMGVNPTPTSDDILVTGNTGSDANVVIFVGQIT